MKTVGPRLRPDDRRKPDTAGNGPLARNVGPYMSSWQPSARTLHVFRNHARNIALAAGTIGLVVALAAPAGAASGTAKTANVGKTTNGVGKAGNGVGKAGNQAAGAARPSGLATARAAVGSFRSGIRINSVVSAAMSQVGVTTSYDPAYVPLAYPGGDVPLDRGVCTDVLIRAFRAVGIDLQVAVHEDMLRNFSAYPKLGRTRPDANIDHRRVKNLSVFFSRLGLTAPVTQTASDYLPGDIVMWNVGGLDHTGLVVESLVSGTSRHQVVHNIGDGAQEEDILFAYPIMGHFRYRAESTSPASA